MSLFKKKKTDEVGKVYTVYLGTATFYHNNGVTQYKSEGSFTPDQVLWLKSNIGRDATFSNNRSSINLKYFFNVEFSFKEEE